MLFHLPTSYENQKGNKFHLNLNKTMCIWNHYIHLPWTNNSSVHGSSGHQQLHPQVQHCEANFHGTLNSILNYVLATGKKNNNYYTFKETLSQPDWNKFLEAMLKKSTEHENQGHWTLSQNHWCLKKPNQLRHFGHSSGNDSLLDHSTNIRPKCVLMVACNNGASITGRLVHLL